MNHYTAIYSAVWLLLLMLLVHRWRNYRTDALRQELFSLRDELFDFALSGKVAFDHPAYTSSRWVINSLIRFAHKTTLSRVALAVWSRHMKWYKVPNPLHSIAELPDGEIKSKFMTVHTNVMLAVVKHLLFGSPVLWMCVLCILLHLAIRGAARKTSDIVGALATHIEISVIEGMAVEIDTSR